MGRVGWGRAITWDDGVHADRGVASQREAKVLLPPVHANDPDEEEEAKIRFRLRVCHVFVKGDRSKNINIISDHVSNGRHWKEKEKPI